MEGIVKKYQQKFKKIREEMNRWDELQSRLISQFRNASSIIERLQIIQDSKNYGSLISVGGIEVAVLRKQLESLQAFLLSMKKTVEDFHGIVLCLEKIHRDGKQLVKGGSNQLTLKQLQQRVGVKPTLADCLDGLMLLHDMHNSEYALKVSLVSALSPLAVKPSTSDLGSLQQLLVDQPNIPKEEVQYIFEIIFAEEIC
ncbi:Pentatricopeptide repeat (PPR) superfamily protein [Melia azedarach]|uniref:Pentatricopeptide repeat (PPR) superfamily protein n=1 Tax=Melia azedarach TaxID=155640 RepID=A0ACC1WV72_MELAZ|nr:Pentatricopeptide repeat (PPR) superfamily protein [Melia azedarach]